MEVLEVIPVVAPRCVYIPHLDVHGLSIFWLSFVVEGTYDEYYFCCSDPPAESCARLPSGWIVILGFLSRLPEFLPSQPAKPKRIPLLILDKVLALWQVPLLGGIYLEDLPLGRLCFSQP
jgi:hypothetical protein